MTFISKERIEEIRKLDLYDYLRLYDPGQLVDKGGRLWSVKDYDSIIIFPDGWHRFSNGQSGKSALDYLVEIKGMTFLEAAEKIGGLAPGSIAPEVEKELKPKNPEDDIQLFLPIKNKTRVHGAMLHYLKSRGILSSVINYFVNKGFLYEGYTKYSGVCCVFVGYNEEGEPKHASIRSIDIYDNAKNKRDAKGAIKRFSMYLPRTYEVSIDLPEKYTGKLHVFESAIDLMSYITLQRIESAQETGNGYTVECLTSNNAYLSPSGVAPKVESGCTYAPAALERVINLIGEKDGYGKEGIRRIELHLDNDDKGALATTGILEYLEEAQVIHGIEVVDGNKDIEDFTQKDINQYLEAKLKELREKKTKKNENTKNPATYKPIARARPPREPEPREPELSVER